MAIQSEHVTGFVVGLGAAAVGFYLYKKNQRQVDAFLRKHGVDVPPSGQLNVEELTIEQLVAEKERLEDIIAEREYAAEHGEAEAPEPSAPAKKEAPAGAKGAAAKS